jgi:hypothetical protein
MSSMGKREIHSVLVGKLIGKRPLDIGGTVKIDSCSSRCELFSTASGSKGVALVTAILEPLASRARLLSTSLTLFIFITCSCK